MRNSSSVGFLKTYRSCLGVPLWRKTPQHRDIGEAEN